MKTLVGKTVMCTLLFLVLISLVACEKETPEKQERTSEKSNQVENVDTQAPSNMKQNSPPEIQQTVMSPVPAMPGTVIRVEVVAEDPDGDNVLFRYDWLRNGSPVFGEHMAELDTSGFDKGDKIVALVTPFDGQREGEPHKSSALVLNNRPPQFLSSPPTALDEGRYIYQVQAHDPDGDRLIYALDDAPEGMVIDDNGLLEWRAEPGQYQVKVVVSDGETKAFQTLGLNITRQQAP